MDVFQPFVPARSFFATSFRIRLRVTPVSFAVVDHSNTSRRPQPVHGRNSKNHFISRRRRPCSHSGRIENHQTPVNPLGLVTM